jgi:predicted NACHT family NTPase
LLQLARDLIVRAEQDECFIEPVPVVFNLSTWSQDETLLGWLATELSTKYQIPRRIGRPWLEQNRLLPLLDGLDEVNLADRIACVKAINAFGQEFGLSGLAGRL